MNPLVYLLREAEESDPYEESLEAAGFRARSFPVLAFRLVRQEELREALGHPSAYSGLILTSPRAVEALSEAMVWLPHQQPAWHAKHVFAVGPCTAAALEEIGFEPEGEESGSGGLLAAYISQRVQAEGLEEPLLFLCGSRRREELPEHLQKEGIPFEELCVYETLLRTDLGFPDRVVPDWVVFFSPSGVEAARQAQGLDWSAVRRAALGPTTAAALEEAGWKPQAVAAEPTPEALADALRSAPERL